MSEFESEEQGPTADECDSMRNESLNRENKIETATSENARHKNIRDIRSNDGDDESKREQSKKVAAVIVRGNPNIADLSDPYRPTKIAEGFSELYDNEWTDAYEELTKRFLLQDYKAIQQLLENVQFTFQFCSQEAERQLSDLHSLFQEILTKPDVKKNIVEKIPNADTENLSVLSQLRKPYAELTIDELQKIIMSKIEYQDKVVEKYCQTAVKLCWLMCIQDPPVYMCNVDDGEQFNRDFYRAYTKSGSQLDYIVWPALRLYKDGPLLYRGVAQFK